MHGWRSVPFSFMCTIYFSLSKCLQSLGWTCFVLTSPFEEKMNAFSSSPPTPPFPIFYSPPAECCCLGGNVLTAEMHKPRSHCQNVAVYFQWEFLCVWWMAYTYRTVEIHSVSYYSQGYTEQEPLSLNDSGYFNKEDRAS